MAEGADPLDPAPATAAKGDITHEDPSRGRQALARRVAESRATIPAFTVTAEAAVDGALALGETLEDLLVKAAGLALKDFPRVNGAYRDARFELHGRVNVALSMEAADGALVAPTVLDADRRPLAEIAAATRTLAERVASGELTSPELAGATFTVATAAATAYEAVIVPSQAAILAAGAPVERAVVRDGSVTVARMVTLTLSADHRIVSPAEASAFVERVRALLEAPDALLD
jgi:pyruvate dehydrogenase E2 component (dihydrolipoamide acetyltransferase)